MRSMGKQRDPDIIPIVYEHQHKCHGCGANTDGRVIVHADDCPYRQTD